MDVGILGPLAVRDASGAVVDVAGARLRTLLTRLALDAGRSVSVGALVDAVWGDEPPADAANALQALVSRLRRALGAAAPITQSAGGYRLAISRDDVDAFRFEELVTSGGRALRTGDVAGAASRLHDALQLWRGPMLADTVSAARFEELRVTARIDMRHRATRARRAGARAGRSRRTARRTPARRTRRSSTGHRARGRRTPGRCAARVRRSAAPPCRRARCRPRRRTAGRPPRGAAR